MTCCSRFRRRERNDTDTFPLEDLPPAVPAPKPISVAEFSIRDDSLELHRANIHKNPFEDMFVIGEDSDSDSDEEDERQQHEHIDPFDDVFAVEVMFDSIAVSAACFEQAVLPDPDTFEVVDFEEGVDPIVIDDEPLTSADDSYMNRLPRNNSNHHSDDDVLNDLDAAQVREPVPVFEDIDEFFFAKKDAKKPESSPPFLSSDDSADTLHGYSAASSQANGQEAFPYFQKKVMKLVQEIFPDEDPSTIVLERMRGGTFNRVVGITIGTDDKQQRHVLRVPRTADFCPPTQLALLDITEDIAPLLFVQKAGIPCAEILTFDQTLSNPLGLPYMIQKRVQGTCLYDCLHKLTHAQRCRLARELGVAYRKMLATTSSVPGRIVIHPSAANTADPSADDLRVVPFQPLHPYPWKQCGDNRLGQQIQPGPPSSDWLIAPFLNRIFDARQEATKPTSTGTKYIDLYADHLVYVDGLRCKGLLDSSKLSYCLTHGDLWPRNIMVNPDAAEDEPFITILDWDSAMFLPSFTMAIPPIWVWDPENYTEPERDNFDSDPVDPAKRELKRIFEQAAGREYLRYSSMYEYKQMRKIMKQVVRGVKLEN